MFRASIFLITLFAVFTTAFGQTTQRSSQSGELFDKINGLDRVFFEAYNKCDVPKMASLFTDDVEFYHEKRGVVTSRKTVADLLSANLCGDPNNKVRRELVEGSLRVYAIDDYGALEIGEHRFYLTQKGQEEKLDGIGQFTNLWQLKSGEWKMSRVLSYGFRSK
jgi:Domain of unknown function (DUF4440)